MRPARILLVGAVVSLATGLLAFAPATTASGRPAARVESGAGLGLCGGIFCGRRLFIIAVGVDAPPQGKWASYYSAPDASKLADRMLLDRIAEDSITGVPARNHAARARLDLPRAVAALANPNDTSTRVQIALLTAEQATPKRVEAAFEQVARKSRPTDVFVFSFGGVSRSVENTRTATSEYYFRLSGIRNFLDDDELRTAGLSTGRLRRLIDNVTAQRQLILLEAGDMREFLPEFVAAMTETRPGVVGLIERNRIIVAPREFGLDVRRARSGALAYAIVSSPRTLFELFSTGRSLAEARLSRVADSLTHSGYLRVFYERDFLDVYSRIVARTPVTRGVGVSPAGDTATATRSPGGRNVALLIGTNRYEATDTWRPLRNPVFDAQTLDTVLRTRFGFETTVLIDPPLDSITFALGRLIKGRKWEKTDQLLVFVAGHGYYEEGTGTGIGMGYLVARDSKPLVEDPMFRTYVSYTELTAWLEKIPSEHILLVLDACFSGTFADAGTRSGGNDEYADSDVAKFIDAKLERRSRWFLTSGGKEYVSDGGAGGHSPFAYRLIDALLRAGDGKRPLTMQALSAKVESAKPTPRAGTWGRNEPGGDFLFIPMRAPGGL